MSGQRFIASFTDSFGFLRTALTGVTTWTDRQIRNTGIVLPHIAKNDGQDTYAGEIALLGADCHYQADRLGSITETHD